MKKYTAEYLNACVVHNYQDRKTVYPPTLFEMLLHVIDWVKIRKYEGN